MNVSFSEEESAMKLVAGLEENTEEKWVVKYQRQFKQFTLMVPAKYGEAIVH